MNRIIKKFVMPSLALLLTACAHHPGQYSTYSSNNAYYPNYPSYGNSQYNRPFYPRPPQPYVYRSYRQPYSGAYQSNTFNNNYYYRNNNNTYRPIHPWPNQYQDGHPNHFPSPNRYGYPNGNWHDHDRDRDDHSSNGRNWHEDNRFSNGQPIPYHREEHHQPSSNWFSGDNRQHNGNEHGHDGHNRNENRHGQPGWR